MKPGVELNFLLNLFSRTLIGSDNGPEWRTGELNDGTQTQQQSDLAGREPNLTKIDWKIRKYRTKSTQKEEAKCFVHQQVAVHSKPRLIRHFGLVILS